MPFPDTKYGKPCDTSDLITIRLDFGTIGPQEHIFHLTWNKHAGYALLHSVADVKTYNENHPHVAYFPKVIYTYNCRPVTGSTTGMKSPSIHAWGLALDVDPGHNPYSKYGDPMPHDIPDWFVHCFTKHGFDWGGSWQSPKDYMHFEHLGYQKRAYRVPQH